ncbi:hypothetical protein FQZ97_748830 [compost metagenome]
MHGVVTDLRADARDAHVDGTVLAVVLDAAQGIEDFLAGQDAPGVHRQQPEKVELRAGQLDAALVEPGLAHGVVDHQRAELQPALVLHHRRLDHCLATPQQRTDARQQHARAHRFAHVVIGAQLQAQHLVHVVGARGEHQDRPLVLAAQLAADGQAVLAGQHQVEHHQVRALLEDARHRLAAIGLDGHLQSVAFQVFARQIGQPLIVFDYEDSPGFLLHHALPQTASGPSKKGPHCSNAGPLAQRMPQTNRNTTYCVSLRRPLQLRHGPEIVISAATNGRA